MQQARAASALNHPNIVTLYNIANESGIDYLVMEYLPGQALDKMIPTQGLPVLEAVVERRGGEPCVRRAHWKFLLARNAGPLAWQPIITGLA